MQPWLSGPVGWSIVPYTKRLQVQSLIRVHMGGNWSFLSHIGISVSGLKKMHESEYGMKGVSENKTVPYVYVPIYT